MLRCRGPAEIDVDDLDTGFACGRRHLAQGYLNRLDNVLVRGRKDEA